MVAWLDDYEGRADTRLTNQWLQEFRNQTMLSEFEDEEDSESKIHQRLDTDRLESIKELLFNIYRVKIGENKLNVAEFMDNLTTICINTGTDSFNQVILA